MTSEDYGIYSASIAPGSGGTREASVGHALVVRSETHLCSWDCSAVQQVWRRVLRLMSTLGAHRISTWGGCLENTSV